MSGKIKIKVGDVYDSNNCGKYTVIEANGCNDVLVRFNLTGAVVRVFSSQIKTGCIKDLMCPIKFGVGFIGVGDHKSEINGKPCKAYSVWSGMMSRCYNENNKCYDRYGRRGVKVADEWHNYQNFAEWCLTQVNFNREDFQIDKDLKNKGSLIYSIDNCEFIPKKLNILLTGTSHKKDGLPVGVQRYHSGFSVQASIGGDKYNKYGFKCENEAFNHYKKVKEDYIKEQANHYFELGDISKCIFNSLMNWSIDKYAV